MSIWSPYRLRFLPEEERAEVAKVQIAEEESTKRKQVEEREKTKRERLGNENRNIVRGIAVVASVLITVALSILTYSVIDVWRDVQVKTLAAKFPGPAPTTMSLQVVPQTDKK